MKRLAIVLLLAALPASAEPLTFNDNPQFSCVQFKQYSPAEAKAFARGFFTGTATDQPLVWYAVLSRRTFYDALVEYCQLAPSGSLNVAAYKLRMSIYYQTGR